MDFELTDDQKMLVDTAASFAKKESPVTRLRSLRDDELGYETKVWRQLGELGWLGILFPDELGGFGGRFIDAALVIEQFGTTLVPEPYIPAVVLGGMSILHAGSAEQQKRWLPPLIEGTCTYALAYAEPASRFDVGAITTTATKQGDSYSLSGDKVWVLNGHAADALVVSASLDGAVRLFVVDKDTAGVHITPLHTMDGQRAARIRFDKAVVDADRLLEQADGVAVLDKVMDLGAAAAVAESVGIAKAVLDMTVEYLKTREQFNVKIGSFQALQHRAVDMFVQVQLCRSMAILSGLRADDADDDRRRSGVSAAKVQLSTGGRYVVRQGIQLHGGIGCTDEHDVGLYFKRMQVLSTLFGDEDYHVARFAAQPSFVADVPGYGG